MIVTESPPIFVDDVDAIEDGLILYVVYERPKDFPECFVLRRQCAGPRGCLYIETTAAASLSVDNVRRLIPEDRVNLGRFDHDDPTILEVWV